MNESRQGRALSRAILGSISLAAAMVVAREAKATAVNVSGTCTLPEAVASLNDLAANPGATPQPGCSYVNDGQSERTVVVPAGNSVVGVTMEVNASMTVVGAGIGQSVVSMGGQFGFYVRGTSGNAPILTLRALSLVGSGAPPAETSAVVVEGIGGTAHALLDQVRVAAFTQNGVWAFGVDAPPIGPSSLTIVDSLVEGNGLAGVEALGVNLTLLGSTIASNAGGGVRAVLNDSALNASLSDCKILDNSADDGGGIFFDGAGSDFLAQQLVILDSTLQGNVAAGDGGGAFITEGNASFERVTITGNVAGFDGGGVLATTGVHSLEVNVSLFESSLVDNEATAGNGGGLALREESSDAWTNIDRCLFAGNVAGGDGGGVYTDGQPTGFDNSTLDGNSASRGGGWFHGFNGESHMNHCTVTRNTATIQAGGLYVNRSNPSFAGNIVADNSAPFAPDVTIEPDLVGSSFGRDCLIGNVESSPASFDPSDGNLLGVDAMLGQLQQLGGPTPVRPLLLGSPALDYRTDGTAFDQRGVVRPQGAGFDIGAFEGSCTENVTELVSNQGFESGTAGWAGSYGSSISSSALQAHTGTRSLRVANRNLGTWQGAEYNLLGLAVPGETLGAKLWTRVEGDPSEPVLFTLRSTCQGQATEYTTVASATANNQAWAALEGTIEIPNCSLSALVVYAEGPRTGVVLYVDAVSIQRTMLQCDGGTPGALTGSINVQSDWGAGYCVELNIHNPNAVPTTNWAATVNLNGTTITGLWNLGTTGNTGSPTLTPQAPWSQVVPAGGNSHSLGFCASRPAGSTALPSGIVATGMF
jgi:predicted outer membrane repeat protein